MEIKTIREVIKYIKEQVILPPRKPHWGGNVPKDECFNDGVKEVIFRLEKLLK